MRYFLTVVCACLALAAECGFGDPAAPKSQPENRTPPAMKMKKVRLADGSEIEVEGYGDTYLGYDFREPYNGNDLRPLKGAKPSREVKTVVDYHNRRSGLAGNLHLRSLILDQENKKLYWTDAAGSELDGNVRRANLDGSRIETVVSKQRVPHGVALDLQHKKVYWSVAKPYPGKIQRADLNGSNIEDIVVGLDSPTGLAVIPEEDALFFSEHGKGRIFRSRLDGSDRKLVIDPRPGWYHPAWRVALDVTTRRIYWNNHEGQILRADLDGKNVETVVRLFDGTGHCNGFDIDSASGKVYFSARDAIHRANLDGTQMEDIVIGADDEVYGVVVDQSQHQIYWVETVTPPDSRDLYGRIRRVKIPPLMQVMEKPSPPIVEGIDPIRQAAGGTVRITGKHFSETSRVLIVGIGTGEFADAKFKAVSNESIEFTVPRLQNRCDEATIIVMNPGGVTLTISSSPLVIPPRKRGPGFVSAGTAFDPWKAGQKFALLVKSDGYVSGMERTVTYVESGAAAFGGMGGNNIFFIKDGATSSLGSQTKSLIFSEPFGIIDSRDNLPSDTKLVQVPAIQISFLKQLFKPQ